MNIFISTYDKLKIIVLHCEHNGYYPGWLDIQLVNKIIVLKQLFNLKYISSNIIRKFFINVV